MKLKFQKILILSCLFLSMQFVFLFSQNINFAVGAGLSKAICEESENWNTGFCGDAALLYSINNNLSIGGRFAYNRWETNSEDISESINIFEISPFIRATSTKKENSQIQAFGQFGLGYY